MNGFKFVGFYFQEIAGENGLRYRIKITPTEESIEKTIGSIESINCVGKENYKYINEKLSLGNVTKYIYEVVDPWVSYYKHTELCR